MPPQRLIGLILLLAVVAGGCWICSAAGDRILTDWLENQCLIESQDKIEWLEMPHIAGDYLVMRGRVIGGAQLHDVRTRYGDTFRATFTLNETKGEELDAVAGIWPQDMASLLENADGSAIFATTYRVASGHSDFRVEFELPRHINRALQRDVKFAVVVWEQDPQFSEPLGVECIEGW